MEDVIKSEQLLDEELRKKVNEVINTLYVDCKNNYGKYNKELFIKVANQYKEKTSNHFDAMIDAYSKL